MAVTWNYENAAHLLSRSAFGGSPETIQNFLDDHASVESAVDEVLEFADKPKRSKPPAKKDDEEVAKTGITEADVDEILEDFGGAIESFLKDS